MWSVQDHGDGLCYHSNMEKPSMRKSIIKQLRQQDKHTKVAIDQKLLEDVQASVAYQEAKVIATYLSFEFEYDTSLLIQAAQKDGKKILIPRTYPKGQMVFVPYDSETLAPTSFGLMEPTSGEAVAKSEIDLIHVPGVAFNAGGYRIGYGAGYYDRYLADFSGATLSTIYNFQEVVFQEEKHDIAVKEVFKR